MKTAAKAKDGIILLVTMTAINVINYAINLLLGRVLGPEAFADFHIIATLALVLAFIGVAVQMTAAKIAADARLLSATDWLRRRVNRISIGACVMMLSLSPFLASFFKLSSFLPFVALGLGLPAYLSLCYYRGLLQGKQFFGAFAMTFLAETLFRTISTVVVVYYFADSPHLIALLAASFTISYIAAQLYAASSAQLKEGSEQVLSATLRPILIFVLWMSIYELGQIIISHSDVLLVKHFFSAADAGQYASISLIGRMVYYGTWTFVMLLFPKVIAARNADKNPSALLFAALGAVLCIGIGVTIFTAIWGEPLMQILFGQAYLEAAPYLYRYAIATTCFTGANVFVYFYLSLEDYKPVVFATVFGLCQIVGIYTFHESITQVIDVQIVLMSMLLVTMLGYYGWITVFRKPYRGKELAWS